MERFRDYLSRFNPSHSYNRIKELELLNKLQVLDDDFLTFSGLLVFGRNESIQRVFPDFRLDLLEIPGTSYPNATPRYTYRIEEQENLWEYFFALFDRLRTKIDIPFILGKEGFAIESSPPLEAIREALVNLIMHADYFSPAKPRIRIFTDRIEFYNPGGLPLPLEKLMKMDVSLPRNPILARIFRSVRLAENAGFGFDRMISGWKSIFGTAPEISTSFDYTLVVFPLQREASLSRDVIEMLQKMLQITG